MKSDDEESEEGHSDCEENEEVQESRIKTPEQENSLYENRFGARNTKLFENLVKKWTK